MELLSFGMVLAFKVYDVI